MHRPSGFSLIEVLVSVVILSIGLLGTAGLMGASVKSTNSAYYRSQATVLADDILDRMRANLTLARAEQYDADLGPVCAGTDSMALYDCTEWTTGVATTLPAGQGTVEMEDEVVTITISWGEVGTESFTTQSRL